MKPDSLYVVRDAPSTVRPLKPMVASRGEVDVDEGEIGVPPHVDQVAAHANRTNVAGKTFMINCPTAGCAIAPTLASNGGHRLKKSRADLYLMSSTGTDNAQQIDVALAGRQRAGTLELTNVEDQSGQSSLQRWPWQDSDTVDGHQRDEMRQAAASVNAGVPMSI